ncbi:spermatogenesis-associated protein 3 isoform X3 [Canis lupus familiaris]|uniref:spermatogenesis-associated protein 3 isoform X3 n=1 Tax=Canis lupus familiaris TaxID=9615 RepID=UPI000BAA3060|nr:spermatogenesis-associated protein 3 isoform X3 [Canis lupus familiaris]|eukprot:XP_022265574.1 spermatogenesis-associated protein 3 isoform X2 [Canis lupus familiaris]
MEPGDGSSGAESPQQARAQCLEGHGQMLLFGELWKQECGLQDVLEQAPAHLCARPSSTRASSGHSRSSNRAPRRPKRPGDSLRNSAHCPAAKSRRCAQTTPGDRVSDSCGPTSLLFLFLLPWQLCLLASPGPVSQPHL